MDSPQSIGFGVTISAPHMHAHALQILAGHLREGSTALDVGCGSGYGGSGGDGPDLTATLAFSVAFERRVEKEIRGEGRARSGKIVERERRYKLQEEEWFSYGAYLRF